MTHYIEGNTYYICGIDGKTLFSITLSDAPGEQIIIETQNEVYSGPIELISFSSDMLK